MPLVEPISDWEWYGEQTFLTITRWQDINVKLWAEEADGGLCRGRDYSLERREHTNTLFETAEAIV